MEGGVGSCLCGEVGDIERLRRTDGCRAGRRSVHTKVSRARACFTPAVCVLRLQQGPGRDMHVLYRAPSSYHESFALFCLLRLGFIAADNGEDSFRAPSAVPTSTSIP